VLPFRLIGDEGLHSALTTALPDELITELSRLRWLLVSARGSSFRLNAADTDVRDVGRLLQVRYCLSGTVEVAGPRLVVTVQLADTSNGEVVWAERFAGRLDDVHSIRDDIRSRVLVELDIQIPMHEAAAARAVASLDAWSAYHLGLQHMYRFNRVDNVAARELFQRAVTLDPHFARAHAGLSFTHFQTAFMHFSDDRQGEIEQARRHAERGLTLDPLDPFVNFTMGRTFWLQGDLQQGLGWLERSVTLCPNYAHGIYARAWSEALGGQPLEGKRDANLAMRLSPLDPLHYAMLATRALSHIASEEDTQAASWAERAARSPGAHVLIGMIATAAHALNGDPARATAWAANVRERNPAVNREDFARAFPMHFADMRRRVLDALARHDL